MRLVVTGGRRYTEVDRIWRALDLIYHLRPVTLLIEGEADGVDTICKHWAIDRGVPVLPFEITKAEWDLYGGRAGKRRNQRMITEGRPDQAVAFPGYNGTADMIERCRTGRVPLIRIPRG